jgi:hypothetical protein
VGIITFSFEKWYDEKGAHQSGAHEHRDGLPMQQHFSASYRSRNGLGEINGDLPEADLN